MIELTLTVEVDIRVTAAQAIIRAVCGQYNTEIFRAVDTQSPALLPLHSGFEWLFLG